MSQPDKTFQEIASAVHVAPSPHLQDTKSTTRRMMVDVLIGLSPAIIAATMLYRHWALLQLVLCVVTCVATEAAFTALRNRLGNENRPITLWDLSAVLTGVILALSLPWNTPWFVSVIGSCVAISLGKMVFGGLGMNLFNPAMVGRAFVMLCFAWAIGAGAYVTDLERNPGNERIIQLNEKYSSEDGDGNLAPIIEAKAVDAITSATPLTASPEVRKQIPMKSVVMGSTYNSLGERGIFVLIGGLFLLIRRTISWQIPAGAIGAVIVIAGLNGLSGGSMLGAVTFHLFSGAFLLGAFFIATDPVTSPVTPIGRWVFGISFGVLVMLLRLLSNYPEGVMFSVLLVNALVPLMNRWTIPNPFGGPVPERK